MSSKHATDPPARRRLLPTYALRLSVVYVLVFSLATSALVGLVYAYAVSALDRETDEVIEAELQGLAEQYQSGGVDALAAVISERVQNGSSSGDVYLLADADMQPVAGNIAAWPVQGRLAERVSVRNMVAILECLADYGSVTKDIGFLVEKVRQALGRQICLQYCDEKKVLRVLTIEPALEKKVIDSRLETNRGIVAGLDPALHRKWITAVSNAVKAVQEQNLHEVILCSEAARPLVRSSTAREIPHLAVISSLEVVPDVVVESLGEIRLEG